MCQPLNHSNLMAIGDTKVYTKSLLHLLCCKSEANYRLLIFFGIFMVSWMLYVSACHPLRIAKLIFLVCECASVCVTLVTLGVTITVTAVQRLQCCCILCDSLFSLMYIPYWAVIYAPVSCLLLSCSALPSLHRIALNCSFIILCMPALLIYL